MKNALLFMKIAGMFIVGTLLAGCYAPLADQKGSMNLGLQFTSLGPPGGTTEVIVLVVNSEFQDSLAETLNLVRKSKIDTLPSSDKHRLKTLVKELAANGLVKFGGFPFYQTTLTGTSGSFDMPGIPEGRGYFVKLFVLNTNVSFKVDDLDQDFWSLVQLENLVFSPETYASDTGWKSWTPGAGQPVDVKAGEAVDVKVTLQSPP